MPKVFRLYVEDAPHGEVIIYHKGKLAVDRDIWPEVEEVASYARALERAGEADLIQKRICDDRYAYCLVKR
jgi:hypothetical protein